ncbi:MerR family DNA-binding transcriptional regulator [Paenibacillus fonticola]|uniref:MerR family DNA-binding transcriptional regulator n=1 Tax=Paenibacillus fonticola TaxID=379896 RepID=UPI001F0A09B5|nr:MerR family DNA-binding transcriptional regulator [Paenibacillus fonticola]
MEESRTVKGRELRLYTVGQLSKLTKVSIRTLHYYEKLGLLHPVRDKNNQYLMKNPMGTAI